MSPTASPAYGGVLECASLMAGGAAPRVTTLVVALGLVQAAVALLVTFPYLVAADRSAVFLEAVLPVGFTAEERNQNVADVPDAARREFVVVPQRSFGR